MPARKPTITVIIHTINEEHNIAACIQTAKYISKDILVVDMNSTDDTVKIAQKKGARVEIISETGGYVEPARNKALQMAKGEWICILDADERMTPQLAITLKKHAEKGIHDIIEMPRKNLMLGHWMKHAAWWPDHITRFFRKGTVSWSKTIHAAPIYTGTVYKLPATEKNALVHHNFITISDILEKITRYAKNEPVDRAADIHSVKDLQSTLDHDFSWRYIEKEGYKDGIYGYVMSEFMRMYRFLIFVHHWEKKGYPKIPGSRELVYKPHPTAHPESPSVVVLTPSQNAERLLKVLLKRK